MSPRELALDVGTVSPIDQARRQLLCAGFGATAAGLLSSAPSLYSMLIFERALPSASLDTLAVFGLVLLLLIVAQVAISWAGQEYLVHTWRMIGKPSRGSPILLQRVDNCVTSGLAWAALSIVPTPILLLVSWAIHPLITVTIGVVLLTHLVSAKLRLHLFPKIIGATISPLFLTLAVGLSIVGSISPGACIAATFLGNAIVVPAREVIRHWRALTASLAALGELHEGGHLRALDRSEQAEAHGFARMVAGGVTGTLAFLGLAMFIPAPSVTVLQGRASHYTSSHIKAPAASSIDRVAVREGDVVVAGQLLVRLDAQDLMSRRELIEAQIEAEDAGLEAALADQERRAHLLAERRARAEAKGGDLVELDLLQAADLQTLAQRVYERRLATLELRERLAEIDRTAKSLEVRAPVDGTVQEVQVGPPGTQVALGDYLLTVVPNADRMVVGRLRPQDRDRIQEGDLADIRVRTSWTRYGRAVRAQVRGISADRYEDGDLRVFLTAEQTLVTGSDVEIIFQGRPQTVVGWASDVVGGVLRRAVR